MQNISDTIVHRYLRIPFFLNVRYKRIKLRAKNTYIFIHGLGDTADLWESIISKLPDDANYVAMDLLGFGNSPKPGWADYNAKVQARSLLRTCYAEGVFGPVTVVGHSLGALVAVEFAKRYPLAVRQLVLCSPPIYDLEHGRKTKIVQQQLLQTAYKRVAGQPDLLINAYAFGQKTRIFNKSLQVTKETYPGFAASLRASIVNQDTMELIEKIKVPIVIIDGRFDILTINDVLRDITQKHSNMTLITINTMHLINKTYEKTILNVLSTSPEPQRKRLQKNDPTKKHLHQHNAAEDMTGK